MRPHLDAFFIISDPSDLSACIEASLERNSGPESNEARIKWDTTNSDVDPARLVVSNTLVAN